MTNRIIFVSQKLQKRPQKALAHHLCDHLYTAVSGPSRPDVQVVVKSWLSAGRVFITHDFPSRGNKLLLILSPETACEERPTRIWHAHKNGPHSMSGLVARRRR